MYCLDSECIECPGCWSEHAATRVPQQQRLRPLSHVYGEQVFFVNFLSYLKTLYRQKGRVLRKRK